MKLTLPEAVVAPGQRFHITLAHRAPAKPVRQPTLCQLAMDPQCIFRILCFSYVLFRLNNLIAQLSEKFRTSEVWSNKLLEDCREELASVLPNASGTQSRSANFSSSTKATAIFFSIRIGLNLDRRV